MTYKYIIKRKEKSKKTRPASARVAKNRKRRWKTKKKLYADRQRFIQVSIHLFKTKDRKTIENNRYRIQGTQFNDNRIKIHFYFQLIVPRILRL